MPSIVLAWTIRVTIIVLTVRNIGAIRTSCRVLRPLVTVFSVTQLDLSDELHRAAFAMNVAHALSSIVGRPIGVTTPLPWRKVVLRYQKARKLRLLD